MDGIETFIVFQTGQVVLKSSDKTDTSHGRIPAIIIVGEDIYVAFSPQAWNKILPPGWTGIPLRLVKP